MNELARWEPFRTGIGMPLTQRFFETVPTILGSVWQPRASSGIRMDVVDADNAYKLAIEIPGASRDTMQVSVYENTVTLSADFSRQENPAGDENWLLRERSYGKVSRSIVLPEAVDDGASEARYNDGILYLTLQKKRASQTKRLVIN